MTLLQTLTAIFALTQQLDQALDTLQQKADKLMASLQNVKDLAAAIDVETTRIANKIDELVAKLAAGGMTEEEEAEALSLLTAQADRLKTIGHDPQNPIPPQP